jgi:hypothetical protein
MQTRAKKVKRSKNRGTVLIVFSIRGLIFQHQTPLCCRKTVEVGSRLLIKKARLPK